MVKIIERRKLSIDTAVFLMECHSITRMSFPLSIEMLDQIPEESWKNPNIKILVPYCETGAAALAIVKKLSPYHTNEHIINNMLYAIDSVRGNIAITRANLEVVTGIKPPDDRVMVGDPLSHEWKMKFDIVFSNPPYNNEKNTHGIWAKFIDTANNILLKEGGYAGFVCPGRWVLPGPNSGVQTRIWDSIIKPYDVFVINHGECSKYFPNVGITNNYFSYFVYQKSPNKNKTKLVSKEGSFIIDTAEFDWLPVNHLNKETLDIWKNINQTNNSMFNFKTRKEFTKEQLGLSDVKTTENVYPIFNGNRDGLPSIKYAQIPVKYQNNKKIIIANSRYMKYERRVFIDYKGEIGYTSSSVGLIHGDENVDYIQSDLYKFLADTVFDGDAYSIESLRQLRRLLPRSTQRSQDEIYRELNLNKKTTEEYIRSIISPS